MHVDDSKPFSGDLLIYFFGSALLEIYLYIHIYIYHVYIYIYNFVMSQLGVQSVAEVYAWLPDVYVGLTFY